LEHAVSSEVHLGVTRPDDLPDFESPPVNEVVLGVQFEPLEGLQTAHLGLLWSRFRSDFPVVEQQPPLPPQPPEDLSGTVKPIEIQVQMLSAPPSPRLYFISESGNQLVQVQNDRFIANWRRVRDEDTYPRYEAVRAYFAQGLRGLLDFADAESLGPIRFKQCEVIYLNQLPAGEGWKDFGDLGEVLAFWTGEMSDVSLPEPEASSVAFQFLLPDARAPRGRLYVDVRPSLRATDLSPLLAMNLTARVPLEEGSPESVLAAVDFGREWIVRAFASTTTPHMHTVWGRRDVRA
jgi:uncharacterized protein (TIGR04255 family)